RGTQRDWTLEAEAAAQAKAEEERRRQEERQRKQAEAETGERAAAPAAESSPASATDEAALERDAHYRRPRDTELDHDPEALALEAAGEIPDWDEIELDDDIPTLLDAIRPHLRRNQKGPGEAAAIDYLAKR